LEFLEPIDWCEQGHDIKGSTTDCDGQWLPEYVAGSYIWSPPPAAAGIVLEELRKAHPKRQYSVYQLLYPYWKHHLYRAAVLILEIPAKTWYWSLTMHKPLILALFLPYVRCKSSELKRSPKLVEVEWVLHGMLNTDSDEVAVYSYTDKADVVLTYIFFDDITPVIGDAVNEGGGKRIA